MKKINIAIDGYSSCGKSTIAKALAKALQYIYIDTGAMYRAVTLYCIKASIVDSDGNFDEQQLIESLPLISVSFDFNQTTDKSEIMLNGENVEEEIRSLKVSNLVSKISVIKEVRQKLVQFQKELTANKGVVMDGRDIGTVVIPDAELKFFMTADKEIRAKRRYEELLEMGHRDIDFNQVLNNLVERDNKDTSREESPLIKANEAVVLDTTNIDQQQQFEIALRKAKEIIGT